MRIELNSSDSAAQGSEVCCPVSAEQLLASPEGSALWSTLIAKCSLNRPS
jgi:hypothetical protein